MKVASPPSAGFVLRCARLLRHAANRHIVTASLRIALVVGLMLNAVNQGEAIWNGAAISVGHLLMNFLVPYCVASFSAARNELSRAGMEES